MVMIVVVHALFMGVMVIEVDVRCHMRMITCGNDDSPYEHGNVSEGNHFVCIVCATRNVYLEVNFERPPSDLGFGSNYYSLATDKRNFFESLYLQIHLSLRIFW